jgi:glycosyltransferase involved in cell wall biosynthesis
VRYVGRVSPEERDLLLSGAAALLYPIQHPEPFGLVVVEALACGTPVLATALGAVPELVEPGVTGYLGTTAAELTALVGAALALDRGRVRERARARFDVRAMIGAHEALYARVAA